MSGCNGVSSVSGAMGWRGAILALLTGSSCLGLGMNSRLEMFMPRREDFTMLWVANGPPQYLTVKGAAPEPVLCLQSGRIGLVMDTTRVRMLRAGRFPKPVDCNRALREGNRDVLALPPVDLQLSVRRGMQKFVCAGRAAGPTDSFFFPVRFVENGRFLQHVAIEGLEFADTSGARFPAKGRLEVALWPDRLVMSLVLEKPDREEPGELEIAIGSRHASSAVRSGQPVVLEVFGEATLQQPIVEAEGSLEVGRSEELSCTVVKLPPLQWKNSKGTPYPEEELDRLDRWRFKVRNVSASEAAVPIVFVDERPAAITGMTPVLCDNEGRPTGIPVQISKNWHRRPDKGDLPHQGPWFHGCTWLRVPPRAEREFTFELAYARYGGVPAASHAQLCLIGWGHNQFWDETAIGSFGESICYEPGRVQRRCMIDDVRPLMTLPQLEAKPYGWAGNCGGGDFLMWIDGAGRYQGFRGTRAQYRAYGPCLTDVCYVEETVGGEIGSKVTVSIARSDDYLRAFHRFRYDVREPVHWQRLAFYQMGSDYYNDTPARRVAVGNSNGVRDEWEPLRAKDIYDRCGIALVGEQPWISIHGIAGEPVNTGGARASRGLIVRSWKAVLGGKPCSEPHASFYATEWGKGNFRTVIDLAPPAELGALRPGDYVEAEVELVVFPTEPGAYYGPNEGFREALGQHADTWHLVQREALGNSLRAGARNGKIVQNYPLVVSADRKGQAAFTLTGGIGYVPVTITGAGAYCGLELLVEGKALNQAVHGNDFWQTDYDEAEKKWRITYNVPRDGQGPSRLEFVRRR